MTVTIEAAVDTSAVAKKKDSPVTPEGVDGELVGRLVEQARAAGLQLTGEGGLLQQLTKRVLEAALDGELTDHLGYEKHDPAGKDGGTPATAVGPRRSSPMSGRSRSPYLGTATAASIRRSCASGSDACPGSRTWCCPCRRRG